MYIYIASSSVIKRMKLNIKGINLSSFFVTIESPIISMALNKSYSLHKKKKIILYALV